MSEGESTEPEPESFLPPPANFRLFLEGFIAQAMVSLGKLPHPTTHKSKVNLAWAKYFIDLLGLMQEKTKGNLEKAEEGLLEGQLSMLRLTFVETKKAAESQAGEGEGDTSADPSPGSD